MTRAEELQAIAEFVRRKGVQRCPDATPAGVIVKNMDSLVSVKDRVHFGLAMPHSYHTALTGVGQADTQLGGLYQ